MNKKFSVGTDLFEISRFRKKSFKKNQSFYKSIFTILEIKHCLNYSDPYIHFAGIFAAKEAIIKCFNEKIELKDIEIYWNNVGKPAVSIVKNKENVEISISHTKSMASAVAIKISRKF